jgi:hypothetical protein
VGSSSNKLFIRLLLVRRVTGLDHRGAIHAAPLHDPRPGRGVSPLGDCQAIARRISRQEAGNRRYAAGANICLIESTMFAARDL